MKQKYFGKFSLCDTNLYLIYEVMSITCICMHINRISHLLIRKIIPKHRSYNTKYEEQKKHVSNQENTKGTFAYYPQFLWHHKWMKILIKANRKILKIIYHSFNYLIKWRNKNHSKKIKNRHPQVYLSLPNLYGKPR